MSDYTPAVRDYLAYCKRAAAWLADHGASIGTAHPSPEGCVKMIPHRGDPGEAKAIREAFRDLTEPSEPAA